MINKRGGWISFCGGWNFSKSVSVGPTFIREMRVHVSQFLHHIYIRFDITAVISYIP